MKDIDKGNLSLREVQRPQELNNLFGMLNIDFPVFARMPLFMLRAAVQKSIATAVLFCGGDTVYGYAVYQKTPTLGLMHILYIAVLPEYRSAGLGGAFMQLLKVRAPGGILLDAEDPAAAKNDAELQVRQKRIAFYERNGFAVYPGFRFKNFGYHMRVMSNVALPDIEWLPWYRRLYNQVYGMPISRWLIRPAG